MALKESLSFIKIIHGSHTPYFPWPISFDKMVIFYHNMPSKCGNSLGSKTQITTETESDHNNNCQRKFHFLLNILLECVQQCSLTGSVYAWKTFGSSKIIQASLFSSVHNHRLKHTLHSPSTHACIVTDTLLCCDNLTCDKWLFY